MAQWNRGAVGFPKVNTYYDFIYARKLRALKLPPRLCSSAPPREIKNARSASIPTIIIEKRNSFHRFPHIMYPEYIRSFHQCNGIKNRRSVERLVGSNAKRFIDRSFTGKPHQ